MRWSALQSSCVLTESRQYSSSPGFAQRRNANSRCTISTAHLRGKKWKKCGGEVDASRGDQCWGKWSMSAGGGGGGGGGQIPRRPRREIGSRRTEDYAPEAPWMCEQFEDEW